ncbi:MAG: outer membrane beta-barrel protein [Alphaproteobacteria bacterium]|nr:outer membrane beta-barrel protein [Alphaproteobacteria bacterium]
MRNKESLFVLAVASLVPGVACAADMPLISPPPALSQPAPNDFEGWYLRGDIGMTNARMASVDRPADPNVRLLNTSGLGFDSATLYGIGAGYQFNNWLRADVTGQWRGRASLHGSHSLLANDGPASADNYSGSSSHTVIMANAYFDLGTWGCVTPYIGAGVGGSYNRLSGFRDDGVGTPGGVLTNSVTYGADAGKWNLAWAVHAGLGYKVTPNTTLELGYSYMNLGDSSTGATRSFDGVTLVNGSPFTVKDITSHDVKLGVRWNFDTPSIYVPPPMPLATKG